MADRDALTAIDRSGGQTRRPRRQGEGRRSSAPAASDRLAPKRYGDTAGSAAAPAARCRNLRRGSFIFEPPYYYFTSFDHLVGEQQYRCWYFSPHPGQHASQLSCVSARKAYSL